MAMPEGVVFSKYEPSYFGALCVKGETLKHDFLYQDIGCDAVESESSEDFVGKLDDAHCLGATVPMDFHCMGRDGCFDENQLFAVWEEGDVRDLIARLKECLPQSRYGEIT